MPTAQRSLTDVVTFSRGTGATRVNAAGLIVGVDFSTSSNTIGIGSKTFVLTADVNVNRDWSIGENVIVVAQAGATGSMTGIVTSYNSNTQTIIINATSTSGSGTSSNWRIGSLEVRRDSKGLLVETAAINSLTNSDNFSAANWGKSGVSVSSNVSISPDGSLNADKLIPAISGGGGINVLSFSTALTFGVFSFYVKSDGYDFLTIERQGVSNRKTLLRISTGEHFGTDGNDISVVSERAPNGFTRFALIGNFNGTVFFCVRSSPVGSVSFNGDGTSGCLIFGFQFSPNSVSQTSYIPTTTVAVTRAADSLSFTSTAVNSIRQGESTVVVTTQNTDSGAAQKRALRLTGPSGEIRVGKQGIGTTASFTKMVESGNTQVFGSSTAGNLIKNLGKQYEAALGTRNDTGATNTNLAVGLTSNAVASSGNGFGVAAGVYELTTDSTLSSVTLRGVGGDTLNGAHWTGSRFIVANGSVGGRPVISLDGASYRVINSPVITQACTEVTSGLVGGITRVVMVGNGGGIYTSDDQGETWTARTPAAIQSFKGVTFGNGRFVAVNDSAGQIQYSDNGISWSNVVSPTAGLSLHDIHFANGLFVAVGNGGILYTSTDGLNFTSRTSGTGNILFGVTYSTNLNIWIAVGGNGTIITAPDPTGTWTTQTSGTTQTLNEVGIFNNAIYIVGNNQTLLTSNNGTTYSSLTAGAGGNLIGIAASPTTLLITGTGGAIASSTEGTIFTSRTNNGATINGIAFGNGTFVSVGNGANGSNYIATIGADGTVTRRVSNSNGNGFSDVIFYDGVFYTTLSGGGSGVGFEHVYSADNGQTWASYFTTISGRNTQGKLAFGNNYVVQVETEFGVRVLTGYNVIQNFRNLASAVSIAGFVPGNTYVNVEFANGVFVLIGSSGRIFRASNPSTVSGWQRVESNTTQNLTSVMYSTRDNCWYAAGANGTLLVSYDNAVTWRPVQDAGVTSITDTTLQANATAQVFVPGTNRIALSYKANRVITSINGHTTVSDTSASIPSITGGVIGDAFNGYITSIRFDTSSYDAQEVSRLSNGVEPDLAINDLAANALGDQLATDAAQNTLNA